MLVFSYITTSFRNLIRQKTYLIINLMGLSVGIAAFLMIMLYINHEKGYDKNIEKRDKIYRVVEIQNEPGVGNQHVAITMAPLAAELKKTFPQVKDAVRWMPAYQISSVKFGDKIFREKNMIYADASILDLFSVNFIKGNPKTALNDPKSIVISEDFANKYFGNSDIAYNSMLLLDNSPYRVTGIMENRTKHSHLFFEALISMSTIEGTEGFEWMKNWGSNSLVTYVLIDDKEEVAAIEKELPRFIDEKILIHNDGYENLEMYLQPLNDLYLDSQHIKFQMVYAAGDKRTVLIFMIVAILVLLIACVNYINISLAKSVKQAKEVGMRKVLGADRMSLVYRFISESFVITLIAILFSVGLLELLLPEVNKQLDTSYKLDFSDPLFNVGLLTLLIVISLVSGSYPAFYLSKFQPIRVLKGVFQSDGRSGLLSKILVVFQFAISIGLIFSILMINKQLSYIQKKDLGINYTNSLFIYFGRNDYKKLNTLKSELLKNPAIRYVSGSSFMNGVSGSQGAIYVDDSAHTKLTVRFGYVDEEFFKAMDIKLLDGRNFDPTRVMDSAGVVIVNQNAIRQLGWEDFRGKRFSESAVSDSSVKPEIIGVISDYHYYSLKSLIEPAVYMYDPEKFTGVTVKYSGQANKREIEEFIEEKWKEIYPATPYQSVFSEQFLYDGYKSDFNTKTLFVYFAFISMFLSCLGLYGLTSLIIEQKTKIIGIKKVLGSPVYRLVYGLVREYMILVAVAGVISIPAALVFINRFLENYPYRVEISIFNIVLSLLMAIVIAFLTIVFKASKTATSNPLEALKYE